MKIDNKYNVGSEVFIIENDDKDIFKAYVEEITININGGGTEISYGILIEMPVGFTTISTDYNTLLECEIFPSYKEAKKALGLLLDEEDKIEERRKLYRELKNEFEGTLNEDEEFDEFDF